MITKTQLKLRVKENLKFAKEFYEGSDSESTLATMLVVDTSKGDKKTGVAAILGNEGAVEKRRDIAFDLGVRAGIELSKKEIDSIDAVYMISEAWYSTDYGKGKGKFLAPSEDPNRKEAIVSGGLSRDGANAFSMFELKRSFDMENGKVKVSFEPLDEMKSGDKKGGMESPLLAHFWNGVELMEKFDKTLPAILKNHLNGLSTDKIFDMFSKSINELRKNKNEYKTIRSSNLN